MRVLHEQPRTDDQPRWPGARLIAFAGLILLLAAGTGGFMVGRSTAPLHRHPTDAPGSPRLDVVVSCRQVPRSEVFPDTNAGDDPVNRVRVEVSFESAWPDGFYPEEEPDVAFIAGPAPDGTVLLHKQDRLDDNPRSTGFLYGGNVAAQKWLRREAPDPPQQGRAKAGPFPAFGERRGEGVVTMFWFDATGELPMQVGFFDVDDAAVIVNQTARCPA